MPRLKNSADSPQSHLYDCFAWTSMALQTSSVRTNYLSERYQHFRATSAPMDYMILCVRFTYLVHLVASKSLISVSRIPDSAIGATLDTGGWLNLTWQGLTPCKMHQASLDALTLATTARWLGGVFASFCKNSDKT